MLAPEEIYVTADQFRAALDRFPHLQVEELSIERREEIPPLFLSSQRTRKYHGNIRELIADLRKFREAGERVAFLFANLGRAERVRDILKEYEIPAHLCRGDEAAAGDGECRRAVRAARRRIAARRLLPSRRAAAGPDRRGCLRRGGSGRGAETRAQRQRPFLSDFRDLKPGDYVVHIDHGIGRFQGLKSIELQEGRRSSSC